MSDLQNIIAALRKMYPPNTKCVLTEIRATSEEGDSIENILLQGTIDECVQRILKIDQMVELRKSGLKKLTIGEAEALGINIERAGATPQLKVWADDQFQEKRQLIH
jgi:DNA-binding FrmR family transcriptional regulator